MKVHKDLRDWLLWSTAFCVLFAATSVSGAGRSAENKESSLIDLDEDNWQLMLKGEWMVEFFAPWCPACKNLAPTWERFSKMAGDVKVNVAKIDVTSSPSLSGRFFVTALPTIYHVKNGDFRQYRGPRDGDALLQFVKQKQWQSIEPLSTWKKPDTIHMSILSYFFKLSHTLKDLNSRLQEEYGLPTWGSYALFAVGTIFVGAALGLMLVCIVDFLYPPKKSQRQSFSEAKENATQIEDIANDEIEDDAPAKDDNDDEEHVDEEDEDEDENDNDNEDEENSSTSEVENVSQSESEEPESDKNTASGPTVGDGPTNIEKTVAPSASPTNPSDVRKRKPRKAD